MNHDLKDVVKISIINLYQIWGWHSKNVAVQCYLSVRTQQATFKKYLFFR